MNINNIQDIYILSPMQRGILFHTLYEAESGVYFNQVIWEIDGKLDKDLFKQAWQRVIQRHSILRTGFFWEDLEQPLQVVLKNAELPVIWHDWSADDQSARTAKLQELLREDRQQGFDLSNAPLMRINLIKVSETQHNLIWSRHHLLMDGWSQVTLLREVFTLYEIYLYNATHAEHVSEATLLADSVDYGAYIEWLQEQDISQAQPFWEQLLKGFVNPTPLSKSWKPRARNASKDVVKHTHYISDQLTSLITEVARSHETTLNTILQGIWACLLAYHSDENDVLFGITVSGRPTSLARVEEIIGLFINTLPLRVRIDQTTPFMTWIKSIQAQQIDLLQYQYSTLTDIHGWSNVPRSLPLFESVLVFENYPMENVQFNNELSLQLRIIDSVIENNLPLTLRAIPGSELMLDIMYDRHLFDIHTINTYINQINTLLSSIANQPDISCSTLLELLQAQSEQYQVAQAQQSKTVSSQKLQSIKRRSTRLSQDNKS